MTVREDFENVFSEENLKKIFEEHVIYSGATGIDNLNHKSFRTQLDEQVKILSRKMLLGNYKFSKYKLKLVSKGKGKIPREISIPTVRDRIAMRAMCDFLSFRFSRSLNLKLPQHVISNVKKDVSSGLYTGCIKLDVTDFYTSLKHSELISRLKKRIRDQEIINIIQSAISSPTVALSRSSDKQAKRGVPQGLAISNVLANIYMINIDNWINSLPDVSYYRYVDDVLILCKYEDAKRISNNVISRFKKIGLNIHDIEPNSEKSSINYLTSPFSYLGYEFRDDLITVRKSTIDRLRASLVSIFTSFKYSKNRNEKFLLWRLNLRITGCVFENKSKGWLFFFSEINDENLLHSLDYYLKKLAIRFNLSIKPKKFSRAFKELSYKRYETNYIPNFDTYTLDQKKYVLKEYFGIKTDNKSEEKINYIFNKKIGGQVKDLQEDIRSFS